MTTNDLNFTIPVGKIKCSQGPKHPKCFTTLKYYLKIRVIINYILVSMSNFIDQIVIVFLYFPLVQEEQGALT